MRQTYLFKSCCVGVLMMFYISAVAEVYKWTDAEGNVHYTAQPPTENNVEVEQIKPLPPIDSSAAIETLQEQQSIGQAIDEHKEDVTELEESKKKRAALRKENCLKVRKKLANINSSGRIRGVDEKGNVTRATDEERQHRISDAQEKIKIWCD